jgi:hypothetical protein
MSWDEAFADRYEEWSAPMTADVAFYAGRGTTATRRLVLRGAAFGAEPPLRPPLADHLDEVDDAENPQEAT